ILPFTTKPDDMGLYRTYIHQPTHIPADMLHTLVDAPTLDSRLPVDKCPDTPTPNSGTPFDKRPLHSPPDPEPQFNYFSPFTSVSSALLMAYQYSGTNAKLGTELDRLPRFLNHPNFHAPD
ncbi:hypothetical protein L210DRAFT_3335053, partial [Boletus edulis BED1]